MRIINCIRYKCTKLIYGAHARSACISLGAVSWELPPSPTLTPPPHFSCFRYVGVSQTSTLEGLQPSDSTRQRDLHGRTDSGSAITNNDASMSVTVVVAEALAGGGSVDGESICLRSSCVQI